MKNNILFHNLVQIQVKNGMVGLGFAYWEWIGWWKAVYVAGAWRGRVEK